MYTVPIALLQLITYSTGGIFRSRMVSREADFSVYGTPLEE